MTKPRILVVDDQLINIRLLQKKLEQNGMEVMTSTSGEQAINLVRANFPDVILLDIMMPGMDGIEVCETLKADPTTKKIPIIFITARTSREGKIEGLGVGAADYLTKPVDLDETLARIHTQLRIIKSHEENLRLTKELDEKKRQMGMMHLTEGIAHNLNNLIGVASGYLSLMKIAKGNPEKLEKNFEQLNTAMKRMSSIVHQLTVIGQFDSIHTQVFPLSKLVSISVERVKRDLPEGFNIPINDNLPKGFEIVTNGELLMGIIERLLMNAWESYPDKLPEVKKKIQLSLFYEAEKNQVIIQAKDEGRGIPEDIRESIFDPFVSTSSAVGKGMGLTIARHSIKNLGGSLELRKNEPKGSIAQITHTTKLEPTL